MKNLTETRPVAETAAGNTRAEALVVAVAAGLATLVWAAATMAGIDLEVRSQSGPSEIGLASVVVTPLLVGALAAGLLRLLERRTANGLRTWTIVATAVWVLSFLGPSSATSVSAGLVLATMHLLVGAAIVGGLRSTRLQTARVA